jgi:hypothetical protein
MKGQFVGNFALISSQHRWTGVNSLIIAGGESIAVAILADLISSDRSNTMGTLYLQLLAN